MALSFWLLNFCVNRAPFFSLLAEPVGRFEMVAFRPGDPVTTVGVRLLRNGGVSSDLLLRRRREKRKCSEHCGNKSLSHLDSFAKVER